MNSFISKDMTMNSSGFVLLSDYVPGIIQEIRYFSTFNFIGDRIDGYEEPVALLTVEAARALKEASSQAAVMGYRFKVYDAYRPSRAVRNFMLWGLEDLDQRMKPFFYPDLEKGELFEKGYIAKKSGHSRGSTIDLTLFDMASGKDLDMGSPFDFFGVKSHPDCREVTPEQFRNRMQLRNIMVNNGFEPIDCEWWHFTLKDEPYPDTYFDFPVAQSSVKK